MGVRRVHREEWGLRPHDLPLRLRVLLDNACTIQALVRGILPLCPRSVPSSHTQLLLLFFLPELCSSFNSIGQTSTGGLVYLHKDCPHTQLMRCVSLRAHGHAPRLYRCTVNAFRDVSLFAS